MCGVSFGFFFQAEDGIRDGHVTGVQTCALPIYLEGATHPRVDPAEVRVLAERKVLRRRSEERRVGKECRSRWSPYHSKKKITRERSVSRCAHSTTGCSSSSRSRSSSPFQAEDGIRDGHVTGVQTCALPI